MIGIRKPIRNMSYVRRNEGMNALDIFKEKQIYILLSTIIILIGILPDGIPRDIFILFGHLLLNHIRDNREYMVNPIPQINKANNNRQINSWSDLECWHNFRFHREDLITIFDLLNFPPTILISNGTQINSQYAFQILLWRLHNNTQLNKMTEVFGRDTTQISRIFNSALHFVDLNHRHIVTNIYYYEQFIDVYVQAIRTKMAFFNDGNYINRYENVFAFIDGSMMEIARPTV